MSAVKLTIDAQPLGDADIDLMLKRLKELKEVSKVINTLVDDLEWLLDGAISEGEKRGLI